MAPPDCMVEGPGADMAVASSSHLVLSVAATDGGPLREASTRYL